MIRKNKAGKSARNKLPPILGLPLTGPLAGK